MEQHQWIFAFLSVNQRHTYQGRGWSFIYELVRKCLLKQILVQLTLILGI